MIEVSRTIHAKKIFNILEKEKIDPSLAKIITGPAGSVSFHHV